MYTFNLMDPWWLILTGMVVSQIIDQIILPWREIKITSGMTFGQTLKVHFCVKNWYSMIRNDMLTKIISKNVLFSFECANILCIFLLKWKYFAKYIILDILRKYTVLDIFRKYIVLYNFAETYIVLDILLKYIVLVFFGNI
jgi:hypothetical protein